MKTPEIQTEMEKLLHKLDKKDEEIQNVKKINEDMLRQLNMIMASLTKEKQ